jgi:mono/diheme cytochrome c family protein
MTKTVTIIGWLAASGFAVFLAAQFVRPSLLQATPGQPIVPQAEIAAPPQVREILQRRCYACHSNEPQLAWFDKVAPASWLVAKDVHEAREHLNFSELGNKPIAAQHSELYEAVNMVRLGAMPLPQYLAVHRGAKVTPEELHTLEAYLDPFAPPKSATSLTPPAVAGSGVSSGPSLNGVPYLSDYKSWKLVDTTDRGDNHTLRLITGNDVAQRAIATGQTSPWPDGAAFAKISVQAVDDGAGHITPGNFIQVEFMQKNAAKYAKTQGWGYARFRGNDLKPYGKDAHFDTECTGCHAPMRANDYVYTMPIPGASR